ncbi:hypothetical protein FHY18_002551 [Xanthomonas arboricola]|nr:hypothetical protein [Xanthomonas sp. 3793]
MAMAMAMAQRIEAAHLRKLLAALSRMRRSPQ